MTTELVTASVDALDVVHITGLRGSGKTTRLLEMVTDMCTRGKTVVFVAEDANQHRAYRRMLGHFDWGRLIILTANPPMPVHGLVADMVCVDSDLPNVVAHAELAVRHTVPHEGDSPCLFVKTVLTHE